MGCSLPRHPSPGRWCAAALLPLLLVSAAAAGPVPHTIPLECRLGAGPWQRCQMRIERVGAHWFLLIDSQRLEFRHDGSGSVRMQTGQGDWRSVSSRWGEDTSLCWDGVCARGDIPLD